MRARNLVLRVRTAGSSKFLWRKPKAELIEDAIHFLGWTREAAEDMTVGQLRLYLKEVHDELKAMEPQLLPKGLAKMRKEAIQEEMAKRRLDHMGKTVEHMMRDLQRWAQEAAQ